MPPVQRQGLVSLSSKRMSDVSMAQLARVMDAGSLELLDRRIHDVGTYEEPQYISTKAGIIEYYQDVYGAESRGTKGWKATLIRDLVALGVSKDAAKKSLQPQRIHQSGGRSPYWAKLGATLPPSAYIEKSVDLTGRQARVTATISFIVSESYKEASFDEILSEEQTAALLAGDFTAALAAYGLPTGNISELEINSLEIELL